MATWVQIKKAIRNNYEVADELQDILKLIFTFADDRSQVVFIEKSETANGELWVRISSPIGLIDSDDIESALEIVAGKICGGLIKANGIHYIRHSILADDLSYDELIRPLEVICGIADLLEEQFIGGDQY